MGRDAQWFERANGSRGRIKNEISLGSHSARHCVPGMPRPVGGELHYRVRNPPSMMFTKGVFTFGKELSIKTR